MLVKIIRTTDGKFVGNEVEIKEQITFSDGSVFYYEKSEEIEGGILRYSNPSYVILTRKINNG